MMADKTEHRNENPGTGDYSFRDMLARIPGAETERQPDRGDAGHPAPHREHPRFSINVADAARTGGMNDQGWRWATGLPITGKVGAALVAAVAAGASYHLATSASVPVTHSSLMEASRPEQSATLVGLSAVRSTAAPGALVVEPVFVRADALASRFSGPSERVTSVALPVDPPQMSGKYDAEDLARALFIQGEARLADGDVTSARMFFKRGADAGDPQSASALGATYDPNLFSRLDVRGMRPDIALARHWYQQAINLGSKDARDRLDMLPAQ
jgi:hypothetical protein